MTAPADDRERLSSTTSLCRVCKRSVDAELWRVADAVVLTKRCPEHGEQEALVSSDYAWYAHVMAQPAHLEAPLGDRRPIDQGCPYDCGACEAHEQRMHLPVVPITSACNLDCPICYTHNKNEGAYHMPPEELDAILGHLKRMHPDQRIINLTGGEPTQHPQLLEIVRRCRDAGVRRVTISTHGIGLDDDLCAALAEVDARIILSFDSFDDDVNEAMLGGRFGEAKMATLDRLAAHDVTTTLLPVLARGQNDDEVARFVDLALEREHVQSVEFHPMTFTGQSGASFDRAARYTTIDALRDLERTSGGRLKVSDFVPSPVAHPLCYLVTYLLKLDDGRWLPFPRFMPDAELRGLLARGLYLEPDTEVEDRLKDVINRLWAGDIACDDADEVLDVLKRLTREMFAPDLTHEQRMRVAERSTKAIYVHTHMDEETFDTDRIRQCCVSMPSADGSTIPSCAYNILYRERDARFTPSPEPALVQLGTGRKDAA